MPDGRLGLIDYGQTRYLTDHERVDIARIVTAIASDSSAKEIAHAMRAMGRQVDTLKPLEIDFPCDEVAEGSDAGGEVGSSNDPSESTPSKAANA